MTAGPRDRDLVMVVDDDPDIRLGLELVLGGCGLEVVSAGDCAEALRRLEGSERVPDMILLDLRMPGMCVQEFREEQLRQPRIAQVPVVLLSGDADIESRARSLGVDRFMMKPVDIDRLLEEVGRYCKAGPSAGVDSPPRSPGAAG